MNPNNPLKILLVDDEEIVRITLQKFIERLGHATECAEEGLSGLRAAKTTKYDAALVDLRMPGIDGIGFLRQTRKNTPELPIVIMSGHGSDETREEAMQAGAFAFLTKPFRFDEIKSLMEQIRDLKHP